MSNKKILPYSYGAYKSDLGVYDAVYGPWNSFKEMVDTLTGRDNSEEVVNLYKNEYIPIGVTVGIIENGKVVEYWKQTNDGGFTKKTTPSSGGSGGSDFDITSMIASTVTSDGEDADKLVDSKLVAKAVEDINKEIVDNEVVISNALNDLNKRVNENSDAVGGFDDRINANTDAIGEINKTISDNEVVVSHALNDINKRTNDNAEAIENVASDLITKTDEIYEVITENEEVISTSLNDLNDRTIENENAIGSISSELSATSDALSELDGKISDNADSISELIDKTDEINNTISDNEVVVSHALNDLNKRTNENKSSIESAVSDFNEKIDAVNEAIDNIDVSGGNKLSEYSIPLMTPEMVERARADVDSGFTDETQYISIDDGSSLDAETEMDVELHPNTTDDSMTTVSGSYLDIMMRTIRALQAEVAKLKNSFEYGIQSYTDENTAMSAVNTRYDDDIEGEPLWAIDEGYLSEIESSKTFNTVLDSRHSFVKTSASGVIDSTNEGQLKFYNCSAKFSDQNRTLEDKEDSKLLVFMTTDSLNIDVELTGKDDKTKTRTISLQNFIQNGTVVNRYGIMLVLSKQIKASGTSTYKGFNYFYASIINYENNEKLVEGYLKDDGTLGFNNGESTAYEIDRRYFISSILFNDLTLYKFKFYTKYEDFNEEVITSQPNENDYKYQASHITIRSVKSNSVLQNIKNQLQNNEMIWVESEKTLCIKSNNKIYPIGSIGNIGGDSDSDSDNNEIYDNMTTQELATALASMGIIVDAQYDATTGEITSLNNIKINEIADFTFVNQETGNKFTYSADTEGNLVCKTSPSETIESKLTALGGNSGNYDVAVTNFRGFIAEYLKRTSGISDFSDIPNKQSAYGYKADRLRISSFYAPISTDEVHGCTHSFIELENSSDVDIPLTGVYLHFYNPSEDKVYHLALDGVIKSGGTYLVRGAKHSEFDDASSFIKVKTFDKEWYDNGQPVSFEQIKVKTTTSGSTEVVADDSAVKEAYRFCLTYGISDLSKSTQLVKIAETDTVIGNTTYSTTDYPNVILNPRFIDGLNFSTFKNVSNVPNGWYVNGLGGTGIVITANSMFRLMFELDPAKQAFNGFHPKDGSRIRYNKDTDLQVLSLSKEFIGFPFSTETIKIERYTPKASFENRTVMTDKTKLDADKPNMITCSLGIDVYNTRCFNWISCGVFDEYVWIREKGTTTWNRFQSYTKTSSQITQSTNAMHRKEFLPLVNNTAYARITNRFPGDNVLFTSHKCIVELANVSVPTTYEYVVGRPDKDLNPDSNHTNAEDIYEFTLYPNTYEGRTYQITDQQGFHWIEYQVWAASAEYLDKKIQSECNAINATEEQKVFPILINTGDMTQSGARINEWLDYYNGGKKMFKHLEQMNCVGNNDLCPINCNVMGTGDDAEKSSPQFFHYFYCFEIPNDEKLIVKAHTASTSATATKSFADKYIPSTYYFKTKGVFYLICNSEITSTTCSEWFGLYSDTYSSVNAYTGIELKSDGKYDTTTTEFTPMYETIYSWLDENANDNIGTDESPKYRRIVMGCHEMPFTVITKASLNNAKATTLPCTRNFPTAGNRLGSNMNQLVSSENRGIFWCSRLLEQFGCKIVIGGHKHTYALSYPIKENYTWTYEGVTHDSKDSTKPMSATLADEALNGGYEVNWKITLDSDAMTEYNIDTTKINTKGEGTTLDSTKAPYIPEELYEAYGKTTFENAKTGLFRCCKPMTIGETDGGKYDGFVNYSMCQATGYKLKSNKELPSPTQIFSKIIPKTGQKLNTYTNKYEDSPNGNQLYPMYSILEFSGDYNSVLNVKMARIHGIFAADGKDSFTQTSFNSNPSKLKTQYLIAKNDMYGVWIDESALATETNRYLYILY